MLNFRQNNDRALDLVRLIKESGSLGMLSDYHAT